MWKKAKNRTSKSPSMRIHVLLECTSRNANCDVGDNSSRCCMDNTSNGRSHHDVYGSGAETVDYHALNQIAVGSVANDCDSTSDTGDPLGLDSFFRELKDVGQ